MVKGDSQAYEKILAAGRQLMLEKGYNGTSLDDICKQAKITKGALFHHFSGKEALAAALLDYHWKVTNQMLEQTPYFSEEDPLKRVILYVELFIMLGKVPEDPISCLFGNLSQELATSSEKIRVKCAEGFANWQNSIAADLENAKKKYPPSFDFNAQSIAEYFISIYEGSLILAKAQKDNSALSRNMEHFRTYLNSLFNLNKI